MKHLKTTIKLSVLALACCGAGALALQPTAYAKADDSAPATCVSMENGAAVYVSDDFSGIRWTTKIDFDKYQVLCGAGKTITFGTLVLPTSMLGEDGVLTEADEGAVDIVANVDVDNLASDIEYYSIINYDNIAAAYEGELSDEEALKKAYAVELTARSYVKVNDTYYLAEEMGSSRSARQVALTAELLGDWSEEETAKANKAAKYYGMTERYVPTVVSDGAAGSAVVDLTALAGTADKEAEKQTVKIKDENHGGKTTADVAEILIAAEKLDVKTYYYNEATDTKDFTNMLAFNIETDEVLPVGEQYVTVFFTDGTFKTYPIVCATKVITEAAELAMFSAKGGYDQYSSKASAWDDGDYWRASQEQSGYYVLGKNIDASAYVHGSRIAADYTDVTGKDAPAGEFNNATWNGYDKYVGKPIGLTGTFNGMGYTIDSMTIGSQREGFFGIVNGGTVKNVAFKGVKATESYNYIIANYLINATISDLYIETNAYDKDDAANNPGYAFNKGTGIFGAYAADDTKISNIFIRLNSSLSATPTLSTFGALFGSTNANEDYTCENVFVYCRQHVKYIVGTTTTVTDETTGETTEKTTYASETVQYYMPMVTTAVAKAAKDDNGEYTIVSSKGTLYVAENQVKDPDAAQLEAYSEKISTDLYNLVVIKGVYTYPQSDKGHVSGTWTDHDYSAFWTSGCWEAGSRGVAWKNL